MTIEARGLACTRGHRRLFTDLSFAVRSGECLELRGPNGSGKTSLLRILCGLVPPASGAVLWNGEPIGAARETYLAALTYVGHRPAVKDDLTAIENLRVSSALSGTSLRPDHAREVLECLCLSEQEHLPARQLSEGQRRRLALARLVASRRPVWLLDEVMTALDDRASRAIVTAIDEHLGRGGIAVIATHQPLHLGDRPRRCLALAG